MAREIFSECVHSETLVTGHRALTAEYLPIMSEFLHLLDVSLEHWNLDSGTPFLHPKTNVCIVQDKLIRNTLAAHYKDGLDI